jgi:hypothetical protein
MKNLFFAVTLMLTLGSFQQSFAQYPIPSYDVSVRSRANFQESQPSRGRRNMNIKVQCGGIALIATCQATVWVYSLDGQTVLGPYTVNGGETLTVPIDDREGGVYIQTEDIITVDVWTSAEDILQLEGLNRIIPSTNIWMMNLLI